MGRVSSDSKNTNESSGQKKSGGPNSPDPRDVVDGRDFADILMGSGRMDPESSLPLPGEDPAPVKSPAEASRESIFLDGDPAMSHPDEEVGPLQSDENAEPGKELRDRAEVIGTSARWAAGWSLRFLVVAAAFWVLGRALSGVWTGILPVILAIIVCTVLWPVVRLLRKGHLPNALAVLLTIILFFAVIGGIIAAIAPSVSKQIPQLVDRGAEGIEQIQNWVAGPPLNLQSDQIDNMIDQATNWVQDQTDQITQTAITGVSAITSGAITLFVMLVLIFFFLKDGEKFLPMVRRVAGRRVGWHLTEVLTRCWNTLGGFIRTQAIVSFIDAFFIGLGLVIMGVPLAGPLAIITFFGGFIPIVGAFTAGALAVLVALVANGFTTALIVLGIVLAVQQLEGNVLQPVLQSKAMKMHAVIVLLSVTVGGGLFGIIGAFLAVPVAAMITEVFRYIGDLTDLATGEKHSADIAFATSAGQQTGAQREQAAQRWQDWKKSLTTDDSGEPKPFSRFLAPLLPDDKDGKGGKDDKPSDDSASTQS
ncbi:Putative membrane protein [Corynebacterium glyciniphilum AJ 3170]|uniref:Putative membrane protein n=1 Tax=Corynebacterium glyciniphilum AJ 3170 TaxID=1404245 RepID=X5DR05_9CORY|nr:AI-2E family transporter [Corynebacterium glyciniphilum]AHW63699.1 Putative membrane protein [Corynebacterium glyciniphilum AJ 3170]